MNISWRTGKAAPHPKWPLGNNAAVLNPLSDLIIDLVFLQSWTSSAYISKEFGLKVWWKMVKYLESNLMRIIQATWLKRTMKKMEDGKVNCKKKLLASLAVLSPIVWCSDQIGIQRIYITNITFAKLHCKWRTARSPGWIMSFGKSLRLHEALSIGLNSPENMSNYTTSGRRPPGRFANKAKKRHPVGALQDRMQLLKLSLLYKFLQICLNLV